MFGEPACTVFVLVLVLKAFVDPDAAPATVSVLPPALAHVPVLVLYSIDNALADSPDCGRVLCYLILLPSPVSPTAPTMRWQILLVVLTLLSPSLSFCAALTMHQQILLYVLTPALFGEHE